MKFFSKEKQPILIVIICIAVVFIIARLISYLVINQLLSQSLFLAFGDFRLHHFVYGNILLVVVGFLAISFEKLNRNWLALIFGIGLGLVLDEFPLWMGDISQLQSNVVFIPLTPWIILATLLLLIVFLLFKDSQK